MGSVQLNKIIYVTSGDYQQFRNYVKERVQEGITFMYIEDEYFLRGRTPGDIVEVGTYRDRWDAHGIEESISVYRKLWKDDVQKDIDSQEITYGEID